MKHSTSMARAWPICCAVLVGLSPVGAAFANGGAAASRQSNAVGATAAPEQTGRQHGGGATYYLDQRNGSDQNQGTRDQPWKTLANLGERVFMPGDRIHFARGTSFHGGVIIRSSGTENARIVLGAYGEGKPPKFTNSDFRELCGNVFHVTGSYITVEGLYFHNGPAVPPGTASEAVRKTGAVFVAQGADHNIIRDCEVYDYPIGFQVYGQHCLVTRNHIHDCTGFLMFPNWGPIGIMVANSHTEISYNRISNYVVTGGAYGADGGAIEIDYTPIPKEDIRVHHNSSVGNEGFLEIIKGDIENVWVHHNVSEDYQQFIFFWGARDCRVEHNTVLCLRPMNAASRTVFVLRKNLAKNIAVRNNIFVVANGLQVFGLGGTHPWPQDFDQPHDHNLYFSLDGSQADPCGSPLCEGEKIGDPLFVDLKNLDLHLKLGSPAIGAGANLGYTCDFDDRPIPRGKVSDIGAYEHLEN